MAFKLKFPITLEDPTGKTRKASANEIKVEIDGDGYAQTRYPEDKGQEGGSAIWFADNAVYVAKLYPTICPYWVPMCRATEPVETGKHYEGNLKWKANEAYITKFSFNLNSDGSVSNLVIT